MNFTAVVFDQSVDTDIARVNRSTGVLYLNPHIWDSLTADEREFVLLHEDGHLQLQTASEYQANRYAIGKYCPVATLTDAELGKRIQVITEITDPTRYNLSGNAGGADPVTAIANGIGSIFDALPLLGVGKKSREEEANNAAANQLKILDAEGNIQAAKSKSTQTLLVVGGMFLVVVIVLVFIFKK